jgi:hypothetical protein
MKSIDWSKWSAIAEILSAVAIVATLLYLAVQTQQTNRGLLANSRAITMTADVSFLMDAEEFLTAIAAPSEDLSPVQLEKLVRQTIAFLRIREFAWFQYQDGILDESAWNSYLRPTVPLFQMENFLGIWASYGDSFDPTFVKAVNEAAGVD